MEHEDSGARQVGQRSDLPDSGAAADVTQTAATGDYDIAVRRPAVGAVRTSAQGEPDPVILAVRELLDLPRQILPEQTYFHLKNAAREATLAIVSLVNSLNRTTGASGDKTPRRIDVE